MKLTTKIICGLLLLSNCAFAQASYLSLSLKTGSPAEVLPSYPLWAAPPMKVEVSEALYVDLLSSEASDTNVDVEMDREGGCGTSTSERFASPFSDRNLKRAKENLVSMLGENPQLKILFLTCRLPASTEMGYSSAARMAYLRDEGIDPLDIYITASLDESDPYIKWLSWKQNRMNTFILGICEVLKKSRPDLKIAILGNTDALGSDWRVKQNELEDWPNWIKSDLIDEVALESDWNKSENTMLLPKAKAILGGTKCGLELVLSLRRNGKLTDPLTQLLNIQGYKFDAIMVRGDLTDDIPKARSFIDSVLPQFQFGI